MPFQPGNNANPHGRPKKPEIEKFRMALLKVEGEKNEDFFVHCIRRAYDDNNLAKEILKKVVPDLVEDVGDNTKTIRVIHEMMQNQNVNGSQTKALPE